MLTTTRQDIKATLTVGGEDAPPQSNELVARYDRILTEKKLNWTAYHRLEKLLGSGGQGVVYLTQRRGADGFTLPVAVKVFSPERYPDPGAYDEAMARIARVSSQVAQIQHDNLLDVHDFVDRRRIRLMMMEWIDGHDLHQLLSPDMLARIRERVDAERWDYINRVIATEGPSQSRLKPGIAVAVLRDCLGALAALHREGVVHGDIKPSNIMLKRTGHSKIVDIGSAFDMQDPPPVRTCTPTYAAPEVLEGGECTPRSDLASMGYVLVEILAGVSPLAGATSYKALLEAKRMLPQRLHEILPREVSCNDLLMNFCRLLIAPDPGRRFPSAEAADMLKEGAAAFQRQLVLSNLAAEYDNEIRLWLEELKDVDDDEEEVADDA